MSKVEQSVSSLKSIMFGESSDRENYHMIPYSIRLPVELASSVEAVAGISKLSKNQVIINFLNLGFEVFEQGLEGEEEMIYNNAVDMAYSAKQGDL